MKRNESSIEIGFHCKILIWQEHKMSAVVVSYWTANAILFSYGLQSECIYDG